MVRILICFSFLLWGCTSPPVLPWDTQGTELFNEVMKNKEKYELQILYTQINKEAGETTFISHSFNLDSTKYFYPASTVKMPVAFLALQRLNEIKAKGIEINRDTPLEIYKDRDAQTEALVDSTSAIGLPSVGHYINKIFAVSDNDAYCRLYEFLGRDYINTELEKINAFTNSRIVTRVGVDGFDYNENGVTNSLAFVNNGTPVFSQDAQQSQLDFLTPLVGTQKGVGYYDEKEDRIIEKLFDFGQKNFISIIDLEACMKRVFFPDTFEPNERFKLSSADYKFLRESMSSYPRSYAYPNYDEATYYDSYVKFFLYGDTENRIPEQIKIYNKVGYAYGTLTECAYIEDTKEDISFLLTATMLVNENGIFNDDTYEYEKTGIPFLAELGRKVYEAELANKLKNQKQ